jgi:hypothetical protein
MRLIEEIVKPASGDAGVGGIRGFPLVQRVYAGLSFAEHANSVVAPATVDGVGAQRADHSVITGSGLDVLAGLATQQEVVAMRREIGAQEGVRCSVVCNDGRSAINRRLQRICTAVDDQGVATRQRVLYTSNILGCRGQFPE